MTKRIQSWLKELAEINAENAREIAREREVVEKALSSDPELLNRVRERVIARRNERG